MKQIYSIIASTGVLAMSGTVVAAGLNTGKTDHKQTNLIESLSTVEMQSEIRNEQSLTSQEENSLQKAPYKVVNSQETYDEDLNTLITNPADIKDIRSYRDYICGLMNVQYQSIGGSNGYNFMNGEAYVNHRMNDALGPDHHSGISMMMWGEDQLSGTAYWDKSNYVINHLVWKYCYNMIYRCNLLLENLASRQSLTKEEQFIKAQTLTMRAHAYTKVMQYYAPRWEDSDSGSAICAIRELKTDNSDHGFITMNEVVDIIYSDLNEALSLYEASGMTRDNKWSPDKSVAQGIYARAAMVIHDFGTAKAMSHEASTGYTVMDNDTYLAGFYTDNNDMIWMSDNDPTSVYYWGEFNLQACNGTYTYLWRVGDAIDMDLVRRMDPNDIRLKCFLTPDKVDVVTNLSSSYNRGNLTGEDFWDPDLVNQDDLLSLEYGPIYNRKYAKSGLYDVAVHYSYHYFNNIFTGDQSEVKENILTNGYKAGYIILNTGGQVRLSSNEYATLFAAPFGAQYKIWSRFPYGSGHYPYMRSTEMKLIEAEASYMTGDEATARNILHEINSTRIDGYSFNGTGSKLLDELQLCRRIELWGEGHNWTDFKRWNLPIVRRAWVANDPTSGNWPPQYAIDTPVSANDGWRMTMPLGGSSHIGVILTGVTNHYLPIGKNSKYHFSTRLNGNLVTKIKFDITPVKGLTLKSVEPEKFEGGSDPVVDFTKLANGDYHVEIFTTEGTELGAVYLLLAFESDDSLERGIMTAHDVSYTMFGRDYAGNEERMLVSGYDVTLEKIEMTEEDTYKLPEPLSVLPEGVSYEWDFNGYDNMGYISVSDDNVITALRKGSVMYSLTINDPLLEETDYGLPTAYMSNSITIKSLPWGDADDSSYVDVADIVTLINYLLGNEVESFNKKYADANRDGEINQNDIQEIVSIILNQPWDPYRAPRKAPAIDETFSFSMGDFVADGNDTMTATLYLTSSKPYSALQTDLKLPESLWLYDIKLLDNFSNHQLAVVFGSDRNRVLIYSPTLDVIPAGDKIPVAVVKVGGTFEDEELVLTANSRASDTEGNLDIRNDADEASVTVVRDTESVFKVIPVKGGVIIEAPENAVGYIFDMYGRLQCVTFGSCSQSLSEGLYVVKFEGSRKVHKVLIK